jgi:hypothetical protein
MDASSIRPRVVRPSRAGGSLAIRGLAAIGVAVAFLSLGPAAASAGPRWIERGLDARELTTEVGCGTDYPCLGWDMRSITMKIRDAENGRSYFIITLRAYNPHCCFASGIALDTTGGPRADLRAYLDQARVADDTVAGPGPSTCGVRRARPDSRIHHGVYRHYNHGSVATCRLPLRWLRPTRHVRWHIWTDDLFPQPYRTRDVAPDGSWWSR